MRKYFIWLPLLLFCFHGLPGTVQAQYSLNSVYGNLSDCDTMTRGIYVVWWDNNWNMTADADELLDSMIRYRNDCLNDLAMADPPNPPAGYYYNVYLHRSNDVFPSGWGNGQGTDSNGYPFLTLPVGAHNDWVNVAHETFHVFQYSATSPGFAYSGDSQWYIEASANWFAAIRNYNYPGAFLEAESLVRLSHVPLWLSYDNFPASYPQNWQRYVHQYAMALLLYYLTEEVGIPDSIITSGLFAGTNELPQEYYYNQLGGQVFRDHFINWAAQMTNHFDFLPASQITVFENEWNNYADPLDDNEIVEDFSNPNGIVYRPADSLVTTGWSFNTYKMTNNSSWNLYNIGLEGDQTGSAGSASYFQAKLVVQNSLSGTSFYDFNMTSAISGNYILPLVTNDTAVYIIVASMPEMFQNVNQTYSYELTIDQIATGLEEELTKPRIEIARYNLLGQKVQLEDGGVQVVYYDDGTWRKVYTGK